MASAKDSSNTYFGNLRDFRHFSARRNETLGFKLGFARLAHALTLRVARPNPHGMLRLRAAHTVSTLPPASLAPTQGLLVGHVAATNSMTAMALRAAGVLTASGLAFCAPTALRSRSDPATSPRS